MQQSPAYCTSALVTAFRASSLHIFKAGCWCRKPCRRGVSCQKYAVHAPLTTPPEVYPAACSLGLLWLSCAQLSSRSGWNCKGALYSAASTARASRGALPLRAKWGRGGHHVTRNRTKYCMGASRALPDGPQRPGFQEDPCTSHDWVTIFGPLRGAPPRGGVPRVNIRRDAPL